jgi:hypothetical protein
MLRHSTLSHDLGAERFRHISPDAQANRLAKLITKLGSPVPRHQFNLTARFLFDGSVSEASAGLFERQIPCLRGGAAAGWIAR